MLKGMGVVLLPGTCSLTVPEAPRILELCPSAFLVASLASEDGKQGKRPTTVWGAVRSLRC